MNILYIHTHDSGDVFSPYGYQVPTPCVQDFSKDATLFENCFCVSPTCSPSRASLLTGKLPHSNGMLGLTNRGFKLNDYNDHLANILNRNGYETVLCGIQHEYGKYTAFEEGGKGIGYQVNITKKHHNCSEKELVNWDKENTDSFIDWVSNRESNKPFFVSLGYFSTHREYPDSKCDYQDIDIPSFLDDDEEIKKDFSGHIESLKYFDGNFGRVIQCLKDADIYDETIIIFTTDHGIPYPMCKCSLFDTGIKVAFIMRVPTLKKGNRIKSVVSHLDVLPTLKELCNLNIDQELEGSSFVGLWSHESKDRFAFSEINFHTSYEPARCIQNHEFKYIKYYDEKYQKINLSNIDNSISKEVFISKGLFDKEMEYFFDLSIDPQMKNNLINSEDYLEKINEMKSLLNSWQVDTSDYLLEGLLKFKEEWIVNTPLCIDPKSRYDFDFIKN